MCVHRCGWTSKYAYAYLNLLEKKDLWPAGHLVWLPVLDVTMQTWEKTNQTSEKMRAQTLLSLETGD
jgi:hypothetical protein